MAKKWAKKEIEFLKTNYNNYSYDILADKLNICVYSIESKMKKLGLKKNKSEVLTQYYKAHAHHTKGKPKSTEQRKKQSNARKIWLKNVNKLTLNKIYKKMAETKKLKFKKGLLIPWNKGKKRPAFSEEWKNNISVALKGHKTSKKVIDAVTLRNKINNPMWDPKIVKKAVKNRNYKEISKKTTFTNIKRGNFLKLSERMKENNPMKNPIINAKVNKNPEYLRRRISSLIKKPNKKEKILIDLINKNNLPYKYVGDGGLIIGSKNPDFVHNKDNKIIELFGQYWHTKKVRVYEETEKGRIEFFKRYNYQTLIIWEGELNNLNIILEKIRSFDGKQ